jgi:hypothetical protein
MSGVAAMPTCRWVADNGMEPPARHAIGLRVQHGLKRGNVTRVAQQMGGPEHTEKES